MLEVSNQMVSNRVRQTMSVHFLQTYKEVQLMPVLVDAILAINSFEAKGSY